MVTVLAAVKGRECPRELTVAQAADSVNEEVLMKQRL